MWKLCGEIVRTRGRLYYLFVLCLKGIPTNESTKQQLPHIKQNSDAIGYHIARTGRMHNNHFWRKSSIPRG
jgi:hypothetical protein